MTTHTQAGDDPLEDAVKSSPNYTLFSRLVSSLKLRAEEEKTTGTWFVPSDRVGLKDRDRPVLDAGNKCAA